MRVNEGQERGMQSGRLEGVMREGKADRSVN